MQSRYKWDSGGGGERISAGNYCYFRKYFLNLSSRNSIIYNFMEKHTYETPAVEVINVTTEDTILNVSNYDGAETD